VRLDELVSPARRIGLAGALGTAFGVHLHFEVLLAGMWSAHERDVDPLEVLPRA
jgi:murein DD-endopeptidase MepM/ murein hydrolase activator NlpD